ncbi:MAG: hypothetical protein KA338_17860, partial [Chloroflexi bacterium]|nr:hypothetical protein [Chloroflexota bacterium]
VTFTLVLVHFLWGILTHPWRRFAVNIAPIYPLPQNPSELGFFLCLTHSNSVSPLLPHQMNSLERLFYNFVFGESCVSNGQKIVAKGKTKDQHPFFIRVSFIRVSNYLL